MEKKRAGLGDIRTAVKGKIRVMPPRREGVEYLELFMLEKKKDKLERDKERMEKGLEAAEEDLKNIKKEIKKLQKLKEKEMEKKKEKMTKEEEFLEKLPSGKEWKTMPLNY